jgi:hypothetical protein
MRLHRLTHRSLKAARALGAMAAILLILAATATARPADQGPKTPATPSDLAPTIVKETVVAPGKGGPDTIVWVLMGVGVGAAVLGAGYLGARIATRTGHVGVS